MSLATLDGVDVAHTVVRTPQHGVWYADVTLLDAPDPAPSGSKTLRIGSLSLSGTVTRYGTRGAQGFFQLVGGAGSWGAPIPAKAYHNDARVRAKLVAEDAARECGETLETLTTTADLGVRYVRRAGPASRALEAAIGRAWYVDADGVTRAGTRAPAAPADGTYTVVDVQPDTQVARLEMDDLGAVTVGMTLTDGFDAPLTVREVEIHVDDAGAYMLVWGGPDSAHDRLGDALGRFVDREQARRLFGHYRYRVSQMEGERVSLQAISQATGLPDTRYVDMRPGVAGAHADLALGSEVLVVFIEGDPKQPAIVGFAGRGQPGHTPTKTTVDIASELLLGAGAADFVALAAKVLTELQSIKTAYDLHTHAYVPGPAGPTTPSAPPLTPLPAPSSVAAAKVKAE